MPSQKPATTGTNAQRPIPADCSIAGIKRLQMEAATMTPAASPVNALCKNALKSFFMNNTPAAPRAVPRKGMKMTLIASPTMSYLPCKNKFRTQKNIHLLLSMPLLYENIAKRLAHSKTNLRVSAGITAATNSEGNASMTEMILTIPMSPRHQMAK